MSNPRKEIRFGIGEAYGLASKSHLDLVIDKINAIFKSEIQFQKHLILSKISKIVSKIRKAFYQSTS